MAEYSCVTSSEAKLHKLIDAVEKKKENNEDLKFDFYDKFINQGKQGVSGIMKIERKNYCIFKISQYLDHLVNHEYLIMKGLNELRKFCPHYCKVFGKIEALVDPNYRKSKNPFVPTSKHPIMMDVLMSEYIRESKNFYNIIKDKNIDDEVIYSTIKQVLMAVEIAQMKKKFTHYDLHSCNILMKKCDKNDVFLYVLDEENAFAVPTYGIYPVIIDFGFSHIEDLKKYPFYGTLAHTEIGFIPSVYDQFSDLKLFLVSVSGEILEKRSSKKSKHFKKLVKNIFSPLHLDWECGWDKNDEISASDHVSEILEESNNKSRIFTKYNHFCIDIIQSLITLPLESKNYDDIFESYNAFIDEFCKIEKEFGSSFYNLYILRVIVDTANDVKELYKKRSLRRRAVSNFKTTILEEIMKISEFCYPSNVKYEKMLCSLIVLARNIEGILYRYVNSRIKSKTREYSKLNVNCVKDVYKIIGANLEEEEYQYNPETTVHVFNCQDETHKTFQIPKKFTTYINDIPSLFRGKAIYSIYKGEYSDELSSEELSSSSEDLVKENLEEEKDIEDFVKENLEEEQDVPEEEDSTEEIKKSFFPTFNNSSDKEWNE